MKKHSNFLASYTNKKEHWEYSMKPLLNLSHISYAYHTPSGEIPSIKDISFDVKKDEFLAIVGPSGCGKSTLLNIIAGLLEPEAGSIQFENPDGSLKYPTIGYMLQKDELLPWRTIFENVTLGLEINHKLNSQSKEEALCLLKKYGLDADAMAAAIEKAVARK